MFLDQICELVEKVGGVVRAGCGFGMILHAKDRQFLVTHSFDCAVVQVDMGHFNFGRERLRIHGETVILRGDRHFAGTQIFDRLIRAAMAKFQLECRSAEREPENLMAETYPDYGAVWFPTSVAPGCCVGRSWMSVPPRATFMTWMPRQIPKIGFLPIRSCTVLCA